MPKTINLTGSVRRSLNSIDWKKIGKWALIAIAGSLFTYFEQQIFPMIDWGMFAPIAVAANSIFVNFFTKLLANNGGTEGK